ncbi:transposon protein [Tanacetum coccineum]
MAQRSIEEGMGETIISCPCKECRNIVAFDDPNMIRRHLIEHGIDKNYTCWDLHGEAREPQVDTHTFVSDTNHEENDSNDDNQDNLDEMLHNAEINVDEKNVKKLQQLFVEAEKAVYNGCKKFTKISFVLRLLDLKAKNNWSDKSFTTLLELLHEAFPKDNELPILTYKAKKLTCPMGLEKHTDLDLGSDELIQSKCLSSRHSTWPVLLCIYNLPPWLCMKRKYIMMSLLIQGPKQPGNDIDVYLRPLIDDMIDLWEKGVEIYDAYKKERFQLFAMIYCTINDFPAYGTCSGSGTKGRKGNVLFVKRTPHPNGLTNVGKQYIWGIGVNARRDMVEMGIRKELAPQETNGTKMYLPPACYTLSKAEKTSFCECLHGVKVPYGYSANIKNLVSMKDLKLLDMKSYDCHILLTQMIPIVTRGLMPSLIRQTITKLCLFFNMIHSKVIDHEKLDELQRDIILILCQLEMYFPPSFFDVMVHLMSHIVEEIKLAEGSIVQGYAAEEVVQFCTNYMDDVADIGLPQPRHQGRLVGVGTIGRKDVTLTIDDFEQAHFTVLQNMTCIEPYIHEHMSYLAENNASRDQSSLKLSHKKENFHNRV